MPEYQVQECRADGSWQVKNGANAGMSMSRYRLDLKARDGTLLPNVELSQKPETAPPAPGAVLDLEIDTTGQYGPKAKKVYKGGQGGGGYSGGRGGGGGMSPERQAAITRQHSQEMALRYATLKGKSDIAWADLVKLVDAFDADVKRAGESAAAAAPAPAPAPAAPAAGNDGWSGQNPNQGGFGGDFGGAPANNQPGGEFSGPATPPAPADDDIPF